MNDNISPEEAISKIVIEYLDDPLQSPDELTIAKLRAARKRALDQTDQAIKTSQWMPIGIALASLIAVFAILPLLSSFNHNAETVMPQASKESLPFDSIDDVHLLASHDNLEMYEDLEFLEWLADSQPTS